MHVFRVLYYMSQCFHFLSAYVVAFYLNKGGRIQEQSHHHYNPPRENENSHTKILLKNIYGKPQKILEKINLFLSQNTVNKKINFHFLHNFYVRVILG